MTKDRLSAEKFKKEIDRLRTELSQRIKELSFFIDSGKALTSTLEFNKVLQIIMAKAQKLIRCEAWSLLLLEENGQELRFAAVKGDRRRKIEKFRLKIGKGIAGWVAQTGQPCIIHDVRKNPHFYKAVDQITRFRTRSILCVPIVNKKKTVGVLELINKRNGLPFDEKDQELLVQLVDQAAIALERSGLYQKMADLAITDDLTKLFNFRYLDQVLDREISRCERYGSVLSIIFFDMDYFKHVNDTHGHLMGSRVLIEVAELLLRNLRNVDLVARYGGDEFVVVLPETTVEAALRISSRLHRAVQNNEFLLEAGLKVKMTASFGIAGYPVHAINKRDLVHLADQAMYQAKNSGRNRICVADAR